MADLVQTAANVRVGATKDLGRGIAGEALVGGEPLYLKAADGFYWKAQCDVDAANATVVGFATHPTNVGQTIEFQRLGTGTFNPGATLTVGECYVLSAAVGKICPLADLASTNFITYLGHASTTALLDLTLAKVTGLQKA